MDKKERKRKEKLENFPQKISFKSSMLGGGWTIQNKKEENARTFSQAIKHRATHVTRPRGHWTQVLLEMVSGIYVWLVIILRKKN
jgi:hypothetical protein